MTGGADSRPGPPLRWRLLAAAAYAVTGLAITGLLAAHLLWREVFVELPAAPVPSAIEVSTVVVDSEGQLLRPFTTGQGRWRLPVALADVDSRFVEMLLAYEDRRFREHAGIDWQAMLRAALQFAGAGGRIVSGGSTLTMQLARLLEQQPTRNLAGKLRQMATADALERQLGKDQILTLYLTLAPYGGNIEGVRAASLAWFGKEPRRLTTAEAALLVALPQSPEARRPDRDPRAARRARNLVLARLAGAGVIAAEEAESAAREPVPEARRPFPMLAPHLAQAARMARPGERQIELTLERRLQAELERLAAMRAEHLGPELSVAILVAEQASGRILASVGSAGLLAEESDGFIDMTKAVRSPGSTLKPLIYGLGFEFGLAHPESLIEDRPTAFSGYVPVNFDGFHRGTVSIRDALIASLNIPAVIVLDAVGTARLVSRLRRAHANPLLPGETAPGLAVGLGGLGMTLRDLVSVYGAIARGGRPLRLEDGIAAPAAPARAAAPVLDPVAAWYVSDILADVAPPLNGSPGRIAYKTGTSYGYRDAWAIGYDGTVVIGVWVGRPDGAPVHGLSGITTAAPLLFESFDRLAGPATPLRPPPQGALVAANTELPEPLRRFRHPNLEMVKRDAAPEIAFPADGTDLDLGLGEGSGAPLVVKVRNGVPPFTFFANGAPFGGSAFARQGSWAADGPGYVTLSVVDAAGRSDAVTVFLN
ncbi:MAG TPA: penicillin-binding protein 1C [Devosiaceae bacterium]|nr:penicillin-binding protein 1C [Devosiaceae bacterium]